MVNVRVLNEFGHESYEGLTIEEAELLIQKEEEDHKCFVVDEETHRIVRELQLEENQSVIVLPIIAGG